MRRAADEVSFSIYVILFTFLSVPFASMGPRSVVHVLQPVQQRPLLSLDGYGSLAAVCGAIRCLTPMSVCLIPLLWSG